MKRLSSFLMLACSLSMLVMMWTGCAQKRQGPPRILVFSKTAGYRHASIPDGIKAIQKLGAANGFLVDTTEDASKFTEDTLKQYSAVVFLSTTHEVLNYREQADFERYIEAGGGFVGIHAAADCGYTWPWYGKLVGAYFKDHPQIQQATLHIHKDPEFPVTDSLPDPWVRTDEWYDFKKVPQDVHVLVSIDQNSYKGSTMGADHPLVWYHKYDGGRSFYMELGHTSESYTESNFLKLLLAGIHYAIGKNDVLDYSKATALRVPDEDRFSKRLLGSDLDEPTEITVLPDLSVLVGERKGGIKFYNAQTRDFTEVAHLNVYCHTDKPHTNVEMGLMGIHIDPHFNENHWVYVYYSPMDKSVDRLSRFKFVNNKFDLSSEQKILEVKTERDMCCHTGGSIAFDAQGNLYLSVGDNTTPFDETDSVTNKPYPLNSHGYAPLDDRPGFDHFDDRRSAGNSNDLRGKILRIKVNADGTYSIPQGNLFAPGTPKTRPEIYVMGDRNPYRISVDQHTGYLYWGEVGPDANNDSMATRGPRGYDEINQARKAGNFGWPYFVGDNYAYHEYNYATGQSGPAFDPEHPINDSRNNTGLRELPPAQPAFIWYPYAVSPEFPILGQGGRCAMAGPVYYTQDYPDSTRYPEYYNGKLFIYDWIRNWIMAVTMNKDGDLQTIEPFMPHTKFHNISDMEVGPDGRLYIVEYGTGWFMKNPDAGLYVIDYNGGNRPPVAALQSDKTSGALPLTVHLSAQGSMDPDGDKIKYSWDLGQGVTKQTDQPDLDYTFTKAGEYPVTLTVTDDKGAYTKSSMIRITAGNTAPQVQISWSGNQTFYFPNLPIQYQVHVNDAEDGSSDKAGFDVAAVHVKADYLQSYDRAAISATAHEMGSMAGKALMQSLDCQSCHKIDTKSIGPAFIMVAQKYKNNAQALKFLPLKIIHGGSGVWGETAMAAHPGLSVADATTIVKWILSLADSAADHSLPLKGTIVPSKQFKLTDQGVVVLSASYTDKGAPGAAPLEASSSKILRNPMLSPAFAKDQVNIQNANAGGLRFAVPTANDASFMFPNISLQDVKSVKVIYGAQQAFKKGYVVELHLDAPDGALLGKTIVGPGAKPMVPGSSLITLSSKPDDHLHQVYVVLHKLDSNEQGYLGIAGIQLQAAP